MDRDNKKTPVNIKLIRGFPVSPRTLGNHPVTARAAALLSSDRSSDFRFFLLIAPSRQVCQWLFAMFVPGHSGGPVPDFHRVPFVRIGNRMPSGQALRHLKIYGATLPAVSGPSQEFRRERKDLSGDRRP
jgi:hypothetical protein